MLQVRNDVAFAVLTEAQADHRAQIDVDGADLVHDGRQIRTHGFAVHHHARKAARDVLAFFEWRARGRIIVRQRAAVDDVAGGVVPGEFEFAAVIVHGEYVEQRYRAAGTGAGSGDVHHRGQGRPQREEHRIAGILQVAGEGIALAGRRGAYAVHRG